MNAMIKLVVCIKQVPMVSELPWDPRTGTLKRETAEGMMNPACRHALEAALQLKETHGGHITVISMGPPMAEEVLREAIALGANRGILLTDPRIAGADTFATSHILGRAIATQCPDFDLILCGCQTNDSETAQVGPQLSEELDIPGVAYAEKLELNGRILRIQRLADNFLETLEFDLPGLVTLTTQDYEPRYVAAAGLQQAFEFGEVAIVDANALGLDPSFQGRDVSPTRIIDVFSPVAQNKNLVMKGTPKKIVEELLDKFDDKIGGAIGKDLKEQS